jgi:hypothetical protein
VRVPSTATAAISTIRAVAGGRDHSVRYRSASETGSERRAGTAHADRERGGGSVTESVDGHSAVIAAGDDSPIQTAPAA